VAAEPWWRRGAVYQVYPRSFADADGDGVGDLAGIRRHLDHLVELGAVGMWLSPVYRSPMADFGYDVADHRDVDPVFGSLADLDGLVADAHDRDLRVVLDFVPNHTSDRHPWFVASRSSRHDPRRHWYVWRDGRDGGPPNDWRSEFPAVGPAWTFDDTTGQWYLHSYLPQQPDLSWDHPDVEAAMHDVVRFWLDRGIDGLRVDALQRLAHDPLLRDNAGADRRRDQDWETAHERVRRLRRVVDEYDDRMLVGEVYLPDLERLVAYLEGGDQLHLAHNFVFLHLPWRASAFRDSIAAFTRAAGDDAWPAWMLSSHDHSRQASRYGTDGDGPARARAAAVLLHALRGTPFVYQGDELGLPDTDVPADRVVDVDGRDPARTPMPWRPPSEAGPGAGFTTATPWLPVGDAAERLAVSRQAGDPGSSLELHRRLGRLRAGSPALRRGDQELLDAGPDVLAWRRRADGDELVVAVNFSAAEVPLRVGGVAVTGTAVLSSRPDRRPTPADAPLALGPDEALVVRPAPAPPPPGRDAAPAGGAS
jgi:alpha-glucosidase